MATYEHRGRDEQVSAYDPDWTNWNDHDPGVTLVTLFGFLAAGLLWRSSGRQQRAGSGLYRVLAVGLGAAGAAAWLLRRRRRRRRPPLDKSKVRNIG
ncbi:MAG: hypothetical protein M3447_09500 [Acidobacteriota bacterium]|nr:hypothetical protein [Acidobacteriota bacterium]